MNVAKCNRTPKRLTILLITLALLTVSALVLSYERQRFICKSCWVGSPVPDAKTLAFLNSNLAPIDLIPMVAYATGSEYTVCNTTHCVSYHFNFAGELVGKPAEPIVNPPPSIPKVTVGGPSVILIEPPPRAPPPRFELNPGGTFGGGSGCVSVGVVNRCRHF